MNIATFFARHARAALPLATLVVAAGAFQPAQAEGTQFALTCVGSETGGTVNFQYRWGNQGGWKAVSVAPGKWQQLTYRYRYAGENRSPKLQIRYDDDLRDGVNFVVTDLASYSARNVRCESEGYTYNFRARGKELFVHDDEGGGLGSGPVF